PPRLQPGLHTLHPDWRLHPRLRRAGRRFCHGNAQRHRPPATGRPHGNGSLGGPAVMAFTAANGRTQTSLSDINITPLVDVVLVLLIIFMVTAPVLQSGIEVNVPKTRSVKEITEERMVISINTKTRDYLSNDHININQIEAKMSNKKRDRRD